MHISLETNNSYMLRFDPSEEVVAGLVDFLSKKNITAAFFQGIGSCSEIELGFFNANLKQYRRKPFYDSLEAVSFNGNGSMLEGKAVVHAHGMFGKTDFTTIGGHVFKAITLATFEVFVMDLQDDLQRKSDPMFNLNILQ